MHYRQKSVLFAAPWLVVGLVAVVVSGGMTVSDFEKPELLVAALFVGVIVGMAVEQCLSAMRRQAWRPIHAGRKSVAARASSLGRGCQHSFRSRRKSPMLPNSCAS